MDSLGLRRLERAAEIRRSQPFESPLLGTDAAKIEPGKYCILRACSLLLGYVEKSAARLVRILLRSSLLSLFRFAFLRHLSVNREFFFCFFFSSGTCQRGSETVMGTGIT